LRHLGSRRWESALLLRPTGCLDAVASGNVLVRELQQAGHDVNSVEATIALARDANPLATRFIRTSP
jgi:predicted NBD/HSP70 family sugar kinase